MGGAARWALNTDLRGAVKIGFGFIIVVVLVLCPWMHFEMKHQAESYQAAVRVLDGKAIREIPPQRAALLTKKGDLYFWRAVVWEKTDAGEKPRMFTATVDKAQDYRVVATTFEPYQSDNALGLSLP